MLGKMLDGSECQLLLDMGASKSFMSKSYYMHCKSLHSLPKFASKTQRIQVGKWSVCQCIIYNPSNYRCTWAQILNLHSSLRDSELVLGIKNVFELEE